jgi:hypothetical protein
MAQICRDIQSQRSLHRVGYTKEFDGPVWDTPWSWIPSSGEDTPRQEILEY